MTTLREEWAEQDEKATREAIMDRLLGHRAEYQAANPPAPVVNDLKAWDKRLEADVRAMGSWVRVDAAQGQVDHFETQSGLCVAWIFKANPRKGAAPLIPLMVRGTVKVWDDPEHQTTLSVNHQVWTWLMSKCFHARITLLEPQG